MRYHPLCLVIPVLIMVHPACPPKQILCGVFPPTVNPVHQTFCGMKDSETFSHSLESCYSEVVHWKRYIFRLPFGHVGNCVVKELTRLFNAFANASALKADVVLPTLLLQRTHAKSRLKEDVVHLERGLKLWLKGDLNTLLVEGRAIHTLQKENYHLD